jgi:hypothetical protein
MTPAYYLRYVHRDRGLVTEGPFDRRTAERRLAEVARLDTTRRGSTEIFKRGYL